MLLKAVLFAFLATAVQAGPVDDLKVSIVRMCYANNVDKVEQVKILMDEYIECYPKIAHIEELSAELVAARNGAVDKIARDNCAKAAVTKTCRAKLNHATALCMNLDLKDINLRIDIANHAIDYLCYEEHGKTRLAKFVEDGGLQCINSGTSSRCDTPVTDDIRAYFEGLSRCLVHKLTDCSNSAAILAQGMFDYIRIETPSSGNNQLLL